MKLELTSFPVSDVRFSSSTNYCNGVLEMSKDELLAIMSEDKRIEQCDLDIASPGEKTRIVNIRDVVEPRIKVSGQGCVFPGILGPVETVGEGVTNRLSGVTVIPSARYRPTILSGIAAKNSSILDMWGPATKYTPFSSTINIVPVFRLVDGVTEIEAHASIQMAAYKISRRLAETTIGKIPETSEIFELSKVDASLPRIIYVLSFVTQWHHPHTFVAYYGLCVRESLPTFFHPNELFDGALTPDARKGSGGFTTTWSWLNQPVALGLLREHGKKLNFLGTILQRTRFEAEHGKQVGAMGTSQMAKILGAEGAIITKTTGSGANYEDVMLTVQACEKKGIKSVLITTEWGGPDGTELPLVFYVPEADAIVTTGSMDLFTKVPAPDKVIGCSKDELAEPLYAGDAPFSPWGDLVVESPHVTGGIDWWGASDFTCKEY